MVADGVFNLARENKGVWSRDPGALFVDSLGGNSCLLFGEVMEDASGGDSVGERPLFVADSERRILANQDGECPWREGSRSGLREAASEECERPR